jgi:hypothetical protein
MRVRTARPFFAEIAREAGVVAAIALRKKASGVAARAPAPRARRDSPTRPIYHPPGGRSGEVPPPKTCYACRSLRRFILVLSALGMAAMLMGCGRRATEVDCRLIVDRSVELQMKEMSNEDPAAIADREQQVRAELEGSIRSCETRRVTDRTMACVRAARAIRDLDGCLR